MVGTQTYSSNLNRTKTIMGSKYRKYSVGTRTTNDYIYTDTRSLSAIRGLVFSVQLF